MSVAARANSLGRSTFAPASIAIKAAAVKAGLSRGVIAVLGCLIDHANERAQAWVSLAAIRAETGYSTDDAVRKALRELRDAGVIETRLRDGATTVYTIRQMTQAMAGKAVEFAAELQFRAPRTPPEKQGGSPLEKREGAPSKNKRGIYQESTIEEESSRTQATDAPCGAPENVVDMAPEIQPARRIATGAEHAKRATERVARRGARVESVQREMSFDSSPERDDIAEAFKEFCDAAARVRSSGSPRPWPKPLELTVARRHAIRIALMKHGGLDGWRDIIERAERSDFLTGRTRGEFRCTLDWLCEPRNLIKIKEGNFENAQTVTHENPDKAFGADERRRGESRDAGDSGADQLQEALARFRARHA